MGTLPHGAGLNQKKETPGGIPAFRFLRRSIFPGLVFLFLLGAFIGLFVHRGREGGELLVGLAFLIERLLQDFGDLVLAERFGQRARGAVGGDLVVFDPLGGADELGIADGVGAFLFDGLA